VAAKGSLHEGGVRVPTIFNWPAKLKPRSVNEPAGNRSYPPLN
jgi:arylsulfatase A-like enzyme